MFGLSVFSDVSVCLSKDGLSQSSPNTKTLLWVLLPRPTIIATREGQFLMSRSKLCHLSLLPLLMIVAVRAWGQG
jgi:hypothetical protein